MNNTKPTYTIYLVESLAVIAALPNGQQARYSYVGCTIQDPLERFKALNRHSARIHQAGETIKSLGLQPGFKFSILKQVDDIQLAQAIETEEINKRSTDPFNLNVVKDSYYASTASRVKPALVGISIAPNHYSGVAILRVNGRHICLKYRCAGYTSNKKQECNPNNPTFLELLDMYGIPQISELRYKSLAARNAKKWRTERVAVTSNGETVENSAAKTKAVSK